MSTTTRIGLNAKLYRNTGSYGSPTWTEIVNVRDLSMDIDLDESDGSIRGGGGFAYSEPTLMKIAVNFNMNHDTSDTNGWDALQTAAFARSAVEFLILDRATAAAAEGIRASMKLYKFSKGEPLAGIQTTDVVAKPCQNANAVPAWYVGA